MLSGGNKADDLLSVKQAAQRIGISTEKCYDLVSSGRLRSVQGAGQRLVPSEAIAAWLAAHPSD
jgi:excisionase family DNA binding protein